MIIYKKIKQIEIKRTLKKNLFCFGFVFFFDFRSFFSPLRKLLKKKDSVFPIRFRVQGLGFRVRMSGKKIQGLRTILSLRQNFLKKKLQIKKKKKKKKLKKKKKKKKKKMCPRKRKLRFFFFLFYLTNRDPMLHTIL